MILFKTITSFRKRLEELLKVRRNVYGGVVNEIKKELGDVPIEQIRMNRDMILLEDDLIVIKLRLPDKKQKLSRKDGYRLIYMVSKVADVVVFLDVYPKNGPMQQLDIDDKEVKRLITEFIVEAEENALKEFAEMH